MLNYRGLDVMTLEAEALSKRILQEFELTMQGERGNYANQAQLYGQAQPNSPGYSPGIGPVQPGITTLPTYSALLRPIRRFFF